MFFESSFGKIESCAIKQYQGNGDTQILCRLNDGPITCPYYFNISQRGEIFLKEISERVFQGKSGIRIQFSLKEEHWGGLSRGDYSTEDNQSIFLVAEDGRLRNFDSADNLCMPDEVFEKGCL